MKRNLPRVMITALVLAPLLVPFFSGNVVGRLLAKEKTPTIDPDDATYRLFQFLDAKRGGKLTDFYVVADVYRDPENLSQEQQHILRADYDKDRGFGKLSLYVRSVGKITPAQMETYTAKDFYEFGLEDLEKFMKTEPGPLGKPGDVYLRAGGGQPLQSFPVTDEVRKTYDAYLTQYLLPALEKE